MTGSRLPPDPKPLPRLTPTRTRGHAGMADYRPPRSLTSETDEWRACASLAAPTGA
jgi:hypothetical protein